jgi:hypothetical protein
MTTKAAIEHRPSERKPPKPKELANWPTTPRPSALIPPCMVVAALHPVLENVLSTQAQETGAGDGGGTYLQG